MENSQNLDATKLLANRVLTEQVNLSDPIAKARIFMVVRIQTYLEFIGFPQGEHARQRLGLIPLIFQEANYDNLDWSDNSAFLEQLNDFFELDCMFQNGGKKRAELDRQTFKAYIDGSLASIRKGK